MFIFENFMNVIVSRLVVINVIVIFCIFLGIFIKFNCLWIFVNNIIVKVKLRVVEKV